MYCVSECIVCLEKTYIFAKVNLMKVRNLFLWRALGGSTISCIVMIFRYVTHSKALNG